MKRLVVNLLMLLLVPGLLHAQAKTSDWNAVDKLKPGTKIIVITKSGREFAGSKRISNDELLFMEVMLPSQAKRTISLQKDEIREIRETKLHWIYKVLEYQVAPTPAGSRKNDFGDTGCSPRKSRTIYFGP